MGVTTPTLFWDSCEKKYGYGYIHPQCPSRDITETPTMSRQGCLLKHPQCPGRDIYPKYPSMDSPDLSSFFSLFFAFSFWCHCFECNYLLLYQFILHSFLVTLCLCAWNCFTILKLYRFNSDLIFKLHTHTHTNNKEREGKKPSNVQVKQQLQSSQITLCTIVLTVLMVIIIILNMYAGLFWIYICMQVCKSWNIFY